MNLKICKRCHRTKEETEFTITTKGYRKRVCRACYNEKAKARYELKRQILRANLDEKLKAMGMAI